MGRLPQPADIKALLSKAISAERWDALLFSILTIILTPVFAAIAVIVILYGMDSRNNSQALLSSRSQRVWPWDGMRWINGFNIFLYSTLGGFFLRTGNDARHSWKTLLWWLAASGSVAFLSLLCYSSSLRETDPRLFWILYGAAGLGTLGFLGVGYVPSDDHFAPPQDLGFSDPTLSRPVDEVAALDDSFLTVIPGIIF
ncbi:MAG TPA: hypothetical protein VMU54_23620, partial [Planctomycetota bacterium]|nr:hypothetical protein [Planctomycetota bacterium]